MDRKYCEDGKRSTDIVAAMLCLVTLQNASAFAAANRAYGEGKRYTALTAARALGIAELRTFS